MTSKTKYIVIVLFTLILASVSVGLSTWNVHYQAEIGTIGYEQQDPVTQESLLNRYVYFEPVKDADGNITNPTKQDYPISGSLNENIFTYVYDGDAHTPNVFTPTESTAKGSTDYPESLFMNAEPLDVNWGIAQSGGVFDDVIFNRQYRLIAMPYVSEHKGKSDNYCEITSIAYGEDTIDITLNWKNGNNGNHQAEGFIVHFVKENGVFVPYLLQNDQYVAYENVQNSKIKQAAFNSVTGALTVQVNGFSPFTVTASNKGWVSAAPSDAGVYQCRITAEYDEESVTDSAAHEAAARTAVSHLNALSDSGTAYAAQVNFAIVAKDTEMADLEDDSFTYQKSASTLKAARRTNVTDTKAPLNAGEDVAAESGLHTINDNVNSFYVTYGGVGFEILIESTFTDINGGSVDVQFSTELLTDAKNLKALVDNWEEDHYYTTYGVSPDPNYHITNPVVHYTVLRREIKIDAWDKNTFVYNGKAQSPAVSAYTDRYGAQFSYTWANASGTTIAKPTDTNEKSGTASYQVRASVGSNYFIACADGAGTLYDDGQTAYVSYDYTITPKPVHLSWGETTLTYNGNDQLPKVTVVPTDIESGDTVNATIACTTTPHKDVGTYQTTSATLDNKNYVIASGEATAKSFNIVPKPVEITWEQDTLTLTYKGEAQAPTAKVKAGDLCGTDQCNVTVDGAEINAGKDYTATATGLSNGNYTLADGTWTTRFNIEPKGVTVVWSTAVLTYNKTAQAPAASVKAGDLCPGDTCTVTVDGQQVNAGTGYTATATGLSNVNYKITEGSTTTFDIEKREVTINWSATSFEYNGEEQAPALTLGNLCDGDSVTASVTVDRTHKDVGNYTATATNISSTNYKLPTANTLEYDITPKEITLVWEKLEFTYDKTAHKPTATVNSDDLCGTDTCTVSVSGEQTNAGTYTATANLSNGNYTATNGTQKFTIKPKEITLVWENLEFTYDGDEHLPTATAGGLLGGDTCNVTVIVVGEHRAAGTYTAQASALDNTNYTLPTANTKEYTIKPKPVEITWADLTLTYNGKAQAPTATVKDGELCGTDQCEVTVTVDGEHTFVGTYTAEAALDNDNYTIANTAQTAFTIAQKGVTVVWSTEPLTYNGGAQAPTATLNGVITGDDCGIEIGGKQTNAGTGYTATATLTGTHKANYTITSGATKTFDIKRAPNTVTITATSGWTYGSKPATDSGVVQASALFGAVDITYYTDADCTSEIAFAEINNAGTYYVKVTSTGDGANYDGDTKTTSFTVAKASNVITFTTGFPAGWTYGDKPEDEADVVQATAQFGGTITFKYYTDEACAAEIAFGDIVNAGTYYVVATSAETDNYSETSATSQFDVTKADYDMSGITFADGTFEYDGQPHSIAISGTLPTGVTVEYENNGKTNVSDSGIVTAVFTTTDNNYNAPANMTATLTITPKLLEKPVNNNTYTYNGTDQTEAIIAGFGYDTLTLEEGLSCSTPNNMTDANTKQIKFTIVSENYTWDDGTTTVITAPVTISPAVISVIDPVIEFAYADENGNVLSASKNIIENSANNISGLANSSTISITYLTDIANETTDGLGNLSDATITQGNTYLVYVKITNSNYTWSDSDTNTSKIRTFYYKYQTALIGSTYYTIEDAISYANTNATSSSKVRILFAGNNTGADTHIITSFSKLTDVTHLPNYHDSYTLTNVEFVVPHAATLNLENESEGKWADVTTNKAAASGNVYAAVIIPQGISLTFESGSILAITAALGYPSDQITRACNRGVLINDGTIIMESGSKLYAYGYIKSSCSYDTSNKIIVDDDGVPITTGTILAKSGTTVNEVMTLYDYPGGNSVTKIMKNAFPSNAWNAHNISCTMRINSGSTYNGYVMVLANDSVQSAFATILGKNSSVENCLFKPESTDQTTTYIVKKTRPARTWTQNDNNYTTLYSIKGMNSTRGQRDVFEIYGNYTDDILTVTVAGQSLVTSKTISAPIGFMDITIKSGANLALTSADYMVLPGSKLVIDAGATMTIDSGVDLAFIDVATMKSWLNVSDSNKSFNNYCVDAIDAFVVVNGTLTVNGSVGGEVRTIGNTGILNLNNGLYATYTTMTGSYGATQDLLGRKTYYTKGNSKSLFGNVINDSYGNSSSSTSFAKAQYKAYNNAWYKVSDVTIKYALNDGSGTINESAVAKGTEVTLTTPTRTGYTFEGWKDSQNNVYGGGQILSFFDNVTLTAQWNKKTYNITVIDENGTNIASGTREYGTPYGDLLSDQTKEGFVLKWQIVGTETFVTATDTVNDIGDHTIQLVWQEAANVVTITFKNSLDDKVISSRQLSAGDSTYTLPNATLEGYSFTGWYTAASGGDRIGGYGDPYTPTANITLYAQWKQQFTVTYNANGGTCDTSTSTAIEGSSVTLPTPTRSNYTFNGWYTEASGGSRIGAAGETYPPTANITLYAQWTKIQYTVTYNANGGSVSPSSATVDAGNSVTLPTPTRSGYTFNGWFTAASGGSRIGAAGETYPPTANITLYAQWTEEESGGCLAAGTLITMADGTQKKVEDLTTSDYLLVFNHETGKYEASKVLFIDYDGWQVWEVIYLVFDNGTTSRIIYEHGFFDRTLNKYVYIDKYNMNEFIGHDFATAVIGATQGVGTAKLIDAYVVNEYTGCYSPTTVYHLNLIADGMLSMPGGIDGMFNFFDYDSETLAYDQQAMMADIEAYGLMTYEDFAEYMSYEVYCCFPAQYISVSLGKGLMTEQDLEYLIERYVIGMDLENTVPTDNGASNIPVADTVVDALPPSTASGNKDGLDSD